MSAHLAAGHHAVRNALRHGAERIEQVWFDPKRRDRRLTRLLDELRRAGVPLQPAGRDELDRLAAGAAHQGVVARVAAPTARDEKYLHHLLDGLHEPLLLLVLDQVQDPRNLGACLRSADAAGAHAVITPRDRAAGLTPAACKAASGAAESVPLIQVTNLARTLRRLREESGVQVVGLAGEAEETLYDLDLTGPLALVAGNEEKGLRRLVRENCDRLARLPLAGSVESLNVSAAASVALFEAVRQRR